MVTAWTDPRRHRVVCLFCRLDEWDHYLVPPKVEIRRSESFVYRGYRYTSLPKTRVYAAPTRQSWLRLLRLCTGALGAQLTDLGHDGVMHAYTLDKPAK